MGGGLLRRGEKKYSCGFLYVCLSIFASAPVNTRAKMFHFSVLSEVCSVPYISSGDTSRHCTTAGSEFRIVAFVNIKIFVFTLLLCICDFTFCTVYGAVRSGNVKILNACSCVNMASLNKLREKKKVFDILNSSGKCSDITSTDSNDDCGKAHAAEGVRGVNKRDVGLGSEACHMLVNLFF